MTVIPDITGSATLTWTVPTWDTDGSPVTTVSGYTVYYGTSPSSLTRSVVLSGATVSSARSRDLMPELGTSGNGQRPGWHEQRIEQTSRQRRSNPALLAG